VDQRRGRLDVVLLVGLATIETKINTTRVPETIKGRIYE
jgi:hypothetical protein